VRHKGRRKTRTSTINRIAPAYLRSQAKSRCKANERVIFTVGLLFERLPCKREFQTGLIQAFIDLHYRELDFFDYFFDQAKK
jgi:hypothetical protein